MTTKLVYGDFTYDLPGDHDAREAYLLQYGFAQSMQDSIAGKAKAWREATNEEGNRLHSDVEVQVMLHDAQQARFDAIVEGTVSHGARGPRLATIDRIMRDVATERLKANAAKTKQSMPKGKELSALVDKYLAKYADSAKEEAQRRMDATAEEVEIDLS